MYIRSGDSHDMWCAAGAVAWQSQQSGSNLFTQWLGVCRGNARVGAAQRVLLGWPAPVLRCLHCTRSAESSHVSMLLVMAALCNERGCVGMMSTAMTTVSTCDKVKKSDMLPSMMCGW